MSWANVAIGGATLLSGILGSNAAGDAADAQSDAAKRQAALQRENMLIQLGLAEPNRQVGYQALGDLSRLYGYSMPNYPTIDALRGGYAGGSLTVPGSGGGGGGGGNALRASAGTALAPLDPIGGALLGGLFGGGGDKPKFGGTINPITGTVDVAGKDAATDATLTHYLRTGEWLGNKTARYRRLINSIDQLRASGWEYDPNAVNTQTPSNPTTGSPTAQPAAGDMSRFFTSPDYQFRQQQGQQAIDRGAAARGGALGGNAVRAGVEYAGNLASGEYGNYVNRLLTMAGLGQVANQNVSTASNNYTAGMGNAYQQQGDARASGIMGGANSVMGAINSGLNGWLMNRYFQQPTAQPTANSAYGPYASGYRFPGG